MKQNDQWLKENNAIQLLVDKYGAIDTHAQASLGYDVILDGKYLDIKVSNSQKLTVLKKLGKGPRAGTTYCPLLEHQEVDYLYMIDKSDYYMAFMLKKMDICNYIIVNAEKLQWSHYNGDGNENLNVKLSFSDFDLIAYESRNFNK